MRGNVASTSRCSPNTLAYTSPSSTLLKLQFCRNLLQELAKLLNMLFCWLRLWGNLYTKQESGFRPKEIGCVAKNLGGMRGT